MGILTNGSPLVSKALKFSLPGKLIKKLIRGFSFQKQAKISLNQISVSSTHNHTSMHMN